MTEGTLAGACCGPPARNVTDAAKHAAEAARHTVQRLSMTAPDGDTLGAGDGAAQAVFTVRFSARETQGGAILGICRDSTTRARPPVPVFDLVSVLWAVIGASIALFAILRVWSRLHPPKESSLGSVSDQWLAEQRLNRPDSQR